MLDRRLAQAPPHQPHRVHTRIPSQINFNIDMKRQISILIVAASLGTSVTIAQQTEHEKQKYTCVMHPEVVMDHPGKCTKCGMTLVPLKRKSQPSTSSIQRPIPNEADMPHMHGSDLQHQTSMEHMSMQSSVNIADPM